MGKRKGNRHGNGEWLDGFGGYCILLLALSRVSLLITSGGTWYLAKRWRGAFGSFMIISPSFYVF